jgi:hypothetical protein
MVKIVALGAEFPGGSVYPTNPMYLASQAQNLARHATPSEANAFNKIALACMVTVALGSVIQVMTPLLEQLNRREKQQRHR